MGNEGTPSPLKRLQRALADGSETPSTVAEQCLRVANSNAGKNTYLSLDPERLIAEAAELEKRYAIATARPPLYGVPISLKDCFDVRGTRTTAGTKFYAERNGIAEQDSRVAERIALAGAMLVGKTHLHPLAYGITGENPDYGDCVQPRDSTLLTGGSSSGAVASVQEGSALIAIGTDTGGSVRVPAALCGLAGYRASHQLAFDAGRWGTPAHGLWAGGIHLAPSFDTVGLFVRDARDLQPAAAALFDVPVTTVEPGIRIGWVTGEFLNDCDPEILNAAMLWRDRIMSAGATVENFAPERWENAQEIFSAIQAHEAAAIHRGNFAAFDSAIAKRLAWGEILSPSDVARYRENMSDFRDQLAQLFGHFDLIALPCAPVRALVRGQDQTSARGKILKYTTPFSLAGMPALSLPGEMVGGAIGSGVQVGARPGEDGLLLAWARLLGELVSDEA